MDGVLVDTGPWHLEAWYGLAERRGWRMSDEFFSRTFGMQNYQIIPQMTDEVLSRDVIDEAGEWKEQRFRELIAGKVKPLEGAAELVGDLKAGGFALAVGSSGPRNNVEMVLESAGLRGEFAVVVAGEDVENSKPAPDTFLRAAQCLSLAPGRCVVIEDAAYGVDAALAAGMAAVAVTTTLPREQLSHAHLVVDSFGELSSGRLGELLV